MRNLALIILTSAGLAGCTLPPPRPAGSMPTVAISGGGSVLTLDNTIAAVAGQPVRIAFLHARQLPDCTLSMSEMPVFNITAQASHGTLSNTAQPDFPVYPANSPLDKCQGMRIPGNVVSYTPAAGYSGTDNFSYQIFFSDGKELITNTTVNVHPVNPPANPPAAPQQTTF